MKLSNFVPTHTKGSGPSNTASQQQSHDARMAAARWTEALRAGQMCLVCEHLVCERLVCNLGLDGVVYGYPCTRSDCPNRVTCGGAA